MKKEIFLSFDINKINNVVRLLNDNNIPCYVKAEDFGISNRSGSLTGSFGYNSAQKVMYYVYVDRKNYEWAKSIIG